MDYIENENGKISVEELCGNRGDEYPNLRLAGYQSLAASGVLQPNLQIYGASAEPLPTRVMLWEIARKILGFDPPNYAQEVGDCVSHGSKNAIEHLQAFEIARGDKEEWYQIHTPYLYGAGRVWIGGNRLGLFDGSIGSWQADAVIKYGVLRFGAKGSDGTEVPPYSGGLARKWGRGSGPPQIFVPEAQSHLIRKVALIQTWDQAFEALANGYPIAICSNVGFTMEQRKSGFHEMSGRWPHCMCLLGMDQGDGSVQAHGAIRNSWNDVHGRVKDWRTGEEWPVGYLRVTRAAIERILSQGDSYAYSQFDGFPAQKFPWEKFSPW